MAQTLYGARGGNASTSDLYTIDPTTGAETSVGPIGYAVTGLAIDPTDGTFYGATSTNSGSDPKSLITIDPATGAGTLVGSFGGGQGVGDIAFDAAGNLFGWGSTFAGLATIDKTTGALTPLGGGGGVGGISFDSADTLWLVKDGDANGGSIYTVDPLDGSETLVLALSGYSAAAFAVLNSAVFDESDVLFASDNSKVGGQPYPTDLVTVDQSLGVVALVGASLTGLDALAWSLSGGSGALEGVCVAFTDDTLEPDPVWTRLDDRAAYPALRVRSWSIHRGRQSELDKTGTGTGTIAFADSDGILDPTNTDGPFYGNIDPMKQAAIALQHPISGDWFTIFRGFISETTHEMQMWSEDRGLDDVTMELADGFDLLAALILTPGDHGDIPSLADFADVYYHGIPSNLEDEADAFAHVDDRIKQLLADAGWPTALQDIFSGNVSVQGKVYDRTDQLLAALFDAADAEFPGVANVYMTKDGIVNFRGRFARFFPDNPGYGINTWKAGGKALALADNTVAPIATLSFRRSKDDIINSVLALPQSVDDADVPAQLVTDVPSIDTFGYRGETFENLQTSAGHDDDFDPTTAVEETKKFAEYYVGNYKDPKTRVTRIGFRPRAVEDPTAQALWDLMCGVEIGDRVHVDTQHAAGTGSGFSEYYYVEGIAYNAQPATSGYHDITLELDLSPASFFDYNPFGTADGTA